MITTEEIQRIADDVTTGIVASMTTTHEPTYEMVDEPATGKRVHKMVTAAVLDEEGEHKMFTRSPVALRDDDGEHIRHPVTTIKLSLGATSCEFDLTAGTESPHERKARTRDEVESIIRTQLGNLLREAIKKPRTVHEHGAWLAKEAERTRVALQAEAVAQEAKRLAGLSDHHRTAEEYLAEYGEHDYFSELGAAGKSVDRLAQLAALEALGGMTVDEATEERERLTAWRDRCEQRHKDTEGATR